jgi:fido (protein-threonine AMPylation protein)
MASPRRKTLEGAFGDLGISKSPRPTPPTSPKKPHNQMFSTIRNSLRNNSGWPFWGSVRKSGPGVSQRRNFTFKMDANYLAYEEYQDNNSAFRKAEAMIEEIEGLIQPQDEKAIAAYERTIEDDMSLAIFGSNYIERVGAKLLDTINICKRVFTGEQINAADLPPRDAEYERILAHLRDDLKIKNPGVMHVARSRREIIQHAQALQHITQAVIDRNEPFSEQLIKQTHKILCNGISVNRDNPTEPEYYSGRYRTVIVQAGSCNFTPPQFVAKNMKELVSEQNDDIRKCEESNTLDPFQLAAKYSMRFLQIHPFQDGNGRICRLILNALLLKYAGIVVSIGEKDKDRSEYMEICKRESAEMYGGGEFATLVLKRSVSKLEKLRASIRATAGL